MATSSRSQGEKYFEVFISYRLPDVHDTSLDRLDRLDRALGEDIISSIKKAIQNTRIAIIIFSENYASSHRCLFELAEIMECKRQGSLLVCPVFYRVLPGEVRQQRGRYGVELAKHEDRLGKDSNKLKRWRDALSEAGDLSGLTLDADGDEAGLFTSIIEKIFVLLDWTPSSMRRGRYDVFLSFRGLDSRHTIISHLYPALCQKGVYTFTDSEGLEAGQRRSELFDAIKASRIAVIMFSENYADSKSSFNGAQEFNSILSYKKIISFVLKHCIINFISLQDYSLAEARYCLCKDKVISLQKLDINLKLVV